MMTIDKILNARSVLAKIRPQCKKASLSYAVMRILKDSDEDERFYIDKYREILNELGEKEEDGSYKQVNGNFLIKEGFGEEFKKKIDELNALEVEDIKWRIKLSDLEDIEVTPEDLYNLDVFINAEE